MLENIKRLGEFIVGKRKFVRVADFNGCLLGGQRLKRDLGLDFEPQGKVEVIQHRKEYQDYVEIDIQRIRRPH